MKELDYIFKLSQEIKDLNFCKANKENDILSCLDLIEKSIKDDIKQELINKQKNIANYLIKLTDKLKIKKNILKEQLEKLDNYSFNKKSLSPNLINLLIIKGIKAKDISELKLIYKEN